jgi:dienelactone hydrolase
MASSPSLGHTADPHSEHDGAVSRRTLARIAASGLGAAALSPALAATAVAAAATPAAPAAPTPAASPAAPEPADAPPAPGAMRLLADDGLNYAALNALGAAGEGAGEVGEVLTAVNAINTAGAGFQTFADTFHALAARLAAEAGPAAPTGAATRRARALRAAQYHAQALFYALGTDRPGNEEEYYREGRRQWDVFAQLHTPAAEFTRVNCHGVRVPVWFFRPDDSGARRPTVIMTNGSDGQNVDLWANGAAEALRRGWNVLAYEGPGQGELLFVEQLPFSPRWERVVTPLVDHLLARSDVDGDRIALTGLSMGGNLVVRAAAFEHRLAAVVTMPGAVSPWLAYPAQLRSVLSADKEATNRRWNQEVAPTLDASSRFLLEKRFEPFDPAALRAARAGRLFTDFWTPARAVVALDVTAVAPRVTSPTLVVDYDDEQFYPGQPRQLLNLLRSPKHYVRLTRADGAQLHCSPMAPQFQAETVFDWLDHTLRTGG